MSKKIYLATFQILMSLVLISCIKTDNSKHETIEATQPKIFTFPIDNEDPCKFGFVEMDNGISIGVTSVCIVNNFVYLTDEYHKNVKRIDILNSNLICSDKITDSTFFKQFNDVIDFNDNLYITSSEKNIYVVDYNLKKSFSFELPTRGGYPISIMSRSDSTIDFSVPVRDSLYRINISNEVVLKRILTSDESSRLTNYFNVELGNIRSKKLEYIKSDSAEYIKIDQKTIKLITPFVYTSDAFNIDYDKNHMAIFNINTQEVKLYIYPLVTETRTKRKE